MWGDNAGGDLGIGSTTYSAYAVQARTNSTTILQNVTDVAIGMDHTVVLTSDGRVYAMGNNSLGALGDGSLTSRSYAVSVKDANGLPITGVRAIAAGRYNTLLLMQDGTVRFTGDNSAGQLGNGTFSPSTVVNPVSIANLTGVELVTMTFQHVLTRRSDGTVWSWGSNSTSQLGDQRTSFTTPNPATPAEVPGI